MKNLLIGIGVVVAIGGVTYATVPRSVLKQYFQTGDKPTQQQFGNTIDSNVNGSEGKVKTGLKEYNSSQEYTVGDTAQIAPSDHPGAGRGSDGSATTKSSIAWRFESAGEVGTMPYTIVTAVVNGAAHNMGKFVGSCSEIGASGGIDGKGLLAGELSAAQCWFAGGGNEIGVFAHEAGGFDIMVGELSEGDAETPFFRGDFKIKTSIPL